MSIRLCIRSIVAFAGAVLCTLAVPRLAEAALLRPNLLDRAVDSLAAAALLGKPAVALVDPARQAAAIRLEHWLLPGFFIAILAQVVALAYYWQSGTAARVRDRLRRAVPSEFVARLLFGASLALVARAAALLPEFYLYRVERAWSLSDQLLRTWGSRYVVNTLVAMLATGIVIAVVLWLVDRTHHWYLYTTAAIFATSIGLVYLNPLLIAPHIETFAPLPVSAQRIVTSLETRAQVHTPIVMQAQQGLRQDSAYVLGFGPSTRIAVGDTLIAVASGRELAFDIANELGYVAMHLAWRVALANAIFLIVGAAIAVTVADRVGFRRDDDPVSRLALVGALLGLVYLVVVPIDNTMLRGMSLDADRYAVALTGDRAAAVRSIVRDTEQNMHEVCPDIMTRLFMDDTASPAARIAAINGVPADCP